MDMLNIKMILEPIQNLESIYGVNLDKNYVDFLTDNSHEDPKKKGINYFDPLRKKNFKTSICTFFHPKISNFGGFLLEDDFYAPDELIENKIIPFGMDAGGYLFCFDYRKNKIPSVVLWIRDNPSGKDITDIATNFEEFLKKLEPEEETNF